MNVLRPIALVAALVLVVAGCGRMADTEELLDVTNVGGMVALPDNGVRYGERLTGAIYDVDDAGNRTSTPITQVAVSKGGERGLRALATDARGRTFASWTDAADDALVVGEVTPGPVKIVWRGPKAATANIAGSLAFAPNGRLAVGIGNLQKPELADDANVLNGKIVTIDVDGPLDQRANAISQGWENPQGLAYDGNGTLWVADARLKEDVLARALEEGPAGDATSLGNNVEPSAMALFGTEELVVCQSGNRKLERYLIDDGVRAVPGRTVSDNCSLGVVQRKDGSLAYATDVAIRATSSD